MDTNTASTRPSSRFGLEIEMHAIRMTLIIGDDPGNEKAKPRFWQGDEDLPASETGEPQTIGGENAIPILVPQDQTGYLKDGKVNWESGWGFRAVKDAGGRTDFQKPDTDSPLGTQMWTFILELQTPANVVEDYSYWACYHACIGIFKNTINDFKSSLSNPIATPIVGDTRRLYPLAELVKRYNEAVLRSNPTFGQMRNKFLVDVSPQLKALAAGGPKGVVPWHAYFTVDEANNWCDVQVNYQMDIESIQYEIANWFWLWGSMWVQELEVILPKPGSKRMDISTKILDEDSGVVRRAPLSDIYRTQLAVALWRTANHVADDLITNLHLTDLPDHILQNIVALVTYIFAAGATELVQEGPVSSKNHFPQLPKTSPCSVVRSMLSGGRAQAALVEAFTKLRAEVTQASNAFSQISDMVASRLPRTGSAPAAAAAPYEGKPTYVEGLAMPELRVMAPLTAAIRTRFIQLWQGTFDLDTALTPANNYGFTAEAPFCVFWAPRTKTKHPPARSYVGEDGQPHVRVLFESRYGLNKLNVGFDPFANDKMFVQSYLSLVRFLDFSKNDAVMDGLKGLFGSWLNPFPIHDPWGAIGPPLKQDFSHGPH